MEKKKKKVTWVPVLENRFGNLAIREPSHTLCRLLPTLINTRCQASVVPLSLPPIEQLNKQGTKTGVLW